MSYRLRISDPDIAFLFPKDNILEILKKEVENDFQDKLRYKRSNIDLHRKSVLIDIFEYYSWIVKVEIDSKNFIVTIRYCDRELYREIDDILDGREIKLLKRYKNYATEGSFVYLKGEENFDVTKLSFENKDLVVYDLDPKWKQTSAG